MTNNAWLSLSLTALLVALAGCSSEPSCGNSHPYLGSRAITPLQAPPGVTLPAADPAYVIPAPMNTTASELVGACMIKPPDVLGALGVSAAKKTMTPTISRHRHGKTYMISKPATTPEPSPTASTHAVPAAVTHGAPVASGGSLE